MTWVLFVLVAVALIAIDLLRGGTRMILALPSYGLLAVAAVTCLFQSRKVALSSLSRLCLVAAALFFGYILARTLCSPEEYLARFNLYMVLAALIVYLISGFWMTSPNARLWFVVVLLLLGIANGLVGAKQFFEGQNYMPFDLMPRSDQYGSRASGFYLNPNHLAGFLEVAILLGLSVAFLSGWPIWGKLCAGYLALMCGGALLITGSRGGYLSLACGLVVLGGASLMVLLKRFPERRGIVLVSLALVTVAAGFAVKRSLTQSAVLGERASTMVMRSDDLRHHMGKAAMRQFRLSPVVGTGSGTYLYYGRQFRTPQMLKDPIYAHNDYLQLLAEYGFVGIAGFFFLLHAHLRSGFNAAFDFLSGYLLRSKVRDHSLALTVGALSCLVAYLVHSVLDFNLHIPANALLMAFVFGLLANPGAAVLPPEDEEVSDGPISRIFDGAWRFVLPALGIWLAVIALPKIPAEYWSERARMLLSTSAFMESEEVAGQVEDAVRRGLSTDPRNPELYASLGFLHMARAEQYRDTPDYERLSGQSAEAYGRAVALAPGDRDLVLNQARSLDAARRFTEAEPLYLRAVELDPVSGEVHWAYGLHLEAQGRLEEAERQLRQAVALNAWVAGSDLERVVKKRRTPLPASPPSPSPEPTGADRERLLKAPDAGLR